MTGWLVASGDPNPRLVHLTVLWKYVTHAPPIKINTLSAKSGFAFLTIPAGSPKNDESVSHSKILKVSPFAPLTIPSVVRFVVSVVASVTVVAVFATVVDNKKVRPSATPDVIRKIRGVAANDKLPPVQPASSQVMVFDVKEPIFPVVVPVARLASDKRGADSAVNTRVVPFGLGAMLKLTTPTGSVAY